MTRPVSAVAAERFGEPVSATVTATVTRTAPGQEGTPVLDALRDAAARARVRVHCPGHKGGTAAGADLVEAVGPALLAADVWLETGSYDRVRREAERLAAQAWGADRAWLLGNGSTAGNLAWCLATLADGDEVVVARDAHTSILTGLVLSGARPVWVPPRLEPGSGLPLGIEPAAVDAALALHPSARHVVLSSPGYSGTCTDVAAVVDVARQHAAGVYVDQAWGALLGFHPDLPPAALAAGADAAVVSLHKLGTALSSGALLLAGPGAQSERIEAAVRATQTTSPLLPLLASVDAARRDLAVAGHGRVEAALTAARGLAARLRAVPGLAVTGSELAGGSAVAVRDPLKLVVDVSGLGRTGWAVEEELRARGVVPEGADARRVFGVIGALEPDPGRTAGELLRALRRVAAAGPARRPRAALPAWFPPLTTEPELTPRQAHQARSVPVPLAAAAGRVAAERAVPYPPGVPVLLPGETVGADTVELLAAIRAAGGHVHGCADPSGRTLRVVVD